MANVLGLFKDIDSAVKGADLAKQAGIQERNLEVLTGSPYPEGAFGEAAPQHRLYVFPIAGAFCGFAVGALLTTAVQVAFPLVTQGKPVLSIPPMLIIMYEGTMLGAILFTIIGILFESRLPRPKVGLYDPRITEGYIGLAVSCPDDQVSRVQGAFQQAGATEVLREPRSSQG